MDLAEAESELVSGFFTEHSSVPFVSFFLAEYGSILLMSVLTTILFLGGYHFPTIPFSSLLSFINNLGLISLDRYNNILDIVEYHSNIIENNPVISGLLNGSILGMKTCFIVFCFIWVRASFPRIRYDQLMQFCWTVILPLLFAFIFLVPCILYSFDAMPLGLF